MLDRPTRLPIPTDRRHRRRDPRGAGRPPAPTLAIATVAALCWTAPAHPEELQPGRIYEAGTRLEVAELGVAFTVPDGWRGTLPAGSEVFVLQPLADPSVTILAIGEAATREELAATMAAPIPLSDAITLRPTGTVGARGAALAAHYEVQGAPTPLAGYGEALASEQSIAVAYLLVASPEALALHRPALEALTDSTTFAVPAAATEPTQEAGSSTGDRWDLYLAGKHLVRFYTATGYTEERHLWLCSDGTFRRSGSSGGFGGGASGAFQADSSGRWTADGAGASGSLTLQFGDGTTTRHDLRWDYQENRLYLDGERWLHDENTVCN